MVESLGRHQPEFTVPDQITGLEFLVEQIGPEEMARAVFAPEEASATDIRTSIERIEGGTMVGILAQAGSSYDVFDRLGRERLTDVMGVPASTSDEDLRAAIRELSRRSWVTELGLDPSASLTEISEEKNRLGLAAAIEKFGLDPEASWEEVSRARERADVGLPPDASDEELEVVRGLVRLAEWANTDHRPISSMPQWQPGESLEDWVRRTQYHQS